MANETAWTSEPQNERDLVLDGPAMRALAHPLRVQIVDLLRRGGPSTATRLADRLGLNSGATSYHLRQLATAGLIAEAADLGNKRDRWWQASYRSTYFDVSSYERDPEAAMAYLNAVASSYAQRTIEFGYAFPALPAEWSEAATMSDFRLRLTADEGRQLLADLEAVVASYRRDDDVEEGVVEAPAAAAAVVVQLQLMPQLEVSATELQVEDRTGD